MIVRVDDTDEEEERRRESPTSTSSRYAFMREVRSSDGGTGIAICAASFLAGTGTWLSVTAIFSEGALLVEYFSEKRIYSTMDLSVQLGNVGPLLLVTVLSKLNTRARSVSMALLVLGACTLVVLAMSWRDGGVLGVASASFVGGLVGASSMVSLFQAAGETGRSALVATSAGVGVCGVIPTAIRFVQGDPEHAEKLRFGLSVFLLLAACWQIAACVGWAVLMRWTRDANSHAGQANTTLAAAEEEALLGGDDRELLGSVSSSSSPLTATAAAAADVYHGNELHGEKHDEEMDDGSTSELRIILAVVFASCFLQYAVPGYIPFLDSNADRVSLLTSCFLCSTILGRIALAVIDGPKLARRFALYVVVQTVAFFITYCMTRMPDQRSSSWHFMTSLLSVLLNGGSHGFIITHGYVLASSMSPAATRWTGFISQAGALFGALLTFVIVRL